MLALLASILMALSSGRKKQSRKIWSLDLGVADGAQFRERSVYLNTP